MSVMMKTPAMKNMTLISRSSKKRKRMEFSQKVALTVVLFSMFIVLLTICLNFVLLWSYRESMAQETIQTIGVFGGVTATAGTFVYGALAGWRDHSKNATGVTLAQMQAENNVTHPESNQEGGQG